MKLHRPSPIGTPHCILALLLLMALPATLSAQAFPDFGGLKTNVPGLGGGAAQNEVPLTMSAHFTSADGQSGQLVVEAKLNNDWYVYSITQERGGPVPSKINIAGSGDFEVGPFQAITPPATVIVPEFDVPIEKHTGLAVWTAPLKVKPGVDLATLEIRGDLFAQACTSSSCLTPEKYPFVATWQVPATPSGYRVENQHAEITGVIEPRVVQPGGTVQLKLTATPDARWYVYALAAKDQTNKTAKPTRIAVDGQVSSWKRTEPRTDLPVLEKDGDYYHEGPVTWTVDLTVPKDTQPGEQYLLTGAIGYQVCKLGTCDRPAATNFDAQITIGERTEPGSVPLTFRPAEYSSVEKRLDVVARGGATASVWFIIGSALLGGFILNFMPCVLPVIGIKILSVVEKAHHDRKEIFWLNFWYVFGMMLVFMVLASLAAFAKLGWGEQFNSLWFNIAMASLVWTMALSFLGVWEIPLPGFAGGQAANDLQQKDGISGAISRGIFTTILATPCSGPLLGAVFTFALTQPPWMIYVIFGFLGLGMGFPYIVMGIFPQLVRWLPKPGAWMETFKQIMGFVLLGTVAFMFTFIPSEYLPQTFTLLIGLWAACWWIGRTPLTATLRDRIEAYAGGVTVAVGVGVLVFGGWNAILNQIFRTHPLPWEPFSVARLEELQAEGKTVMVDFTADWCLTCKLNLASALNVEDVKNTVESNGVVTLLADWSGGSEEIKNFLAQHGQNSIPFLLIYPAGKPDEPIRLSDLLTKGDVLEALEQAGPSKTAIPAASPAAQTTQRPVPGTSPTAALSPQ